MSQQSPFEKVPSQGDFPAMERAVLELWTELDAFHESNRRREGNEPFVFYDGPPFATGTPHYGHLLAGTIKDTVTSVSSNSVKRNVKLNSKLSNQFD